MNSVLARLLLSLTASMRFEVRAMHWRRALHTQSARRRGALARGRKRAHLRFHCDRQCNASPCRGRA